MLIREGGRVCIASEQALISLRLRQNQGEIGCRMHARTLVVNNNISSKQKAVLIHFNIFKIGAVNQKPEHLPTICGFYTRCPFKPLALILQMRVSST